MNHLSFEKSPYLLQHAENPVEWYPWSEEAFKKAKLENKPVFLSIGYSTCHWCHVMENESFEDEEIAGLMNDAFISIKVDREERPDIDNIYMSICQMLTGSGGWPLTVLMTPDKEPFFAGTYFPKESRFGMPGMRELIPHLKDIWLHRRKEVIKSASEIINALGNVAPSAGNGVNKNIFNKAFNEFERRFDPESGGFGSAPKFPSPHNLYFLLRYYKRFGDENALTMTEKTLRHMRMGGIFDQLGFGFHRYSTDSKWLVPHFEKMLYDQALLTIAYLELYQITGDRIYRQTVEEILHYVQRDMMSPDGGFYSAEDADSEGIEGKFYLWSKKEIELVLEKDAELVSENFSVSDEGNIPGEKSGNNILHLTESLSEIAEEKNIEKINDAVRKLFDVREKRVHPYKDDKILTDWNGLMISAFARASQVFNNKLYEDTAVKAAEFLLSGLKDTKGGMLHRYRDGEAGITANLDDYAFLIMGLIDIYEATFNVHWLKTAIELNEYVINHFWDTNNGGFFFTPDFGEKLIIRQKEIYDGAVPSGNSVAVLNLLKLGRITGNISLEDKAFKITEIFAAQVNRMPSAFSQLLTGLDFGFGESFEIVIIGKRGDKLTLEIIEYLRSVFLPNKIILFKEPGDFELKNIAPFTEMQSQIEEKTTVYICKNYVCEKPVTTLNEIKKILK